MFYFIALFYLQVLVSPIFSIIGDHDDPLTVIGDKSMTLRSKEIPQLISKLLLDGPFYCFVKWSEKKQSIDIYTDYNIHPYIVLNIQKDVLHVTFQSDGNFKFTEMNIYLNLHPTINSIFLGGLTTLNSTNVFHSNNPLKIHAQDTSSLLIELDVFDLNAMFLSAGIIELAGHVKDKAIIKYFGIGNVDASQLYCKSIDIEANGLGTIAIAGTHECIIKADGVSTVKYNCSNTHNVQLSGLAKLVPS